MKIYDISKELFATEVFPGDPSPEQKEFFTVEQGDICNLSVLSFGSHNGTHMDAPWHFIPDGKQIHQIDPEQCVGKCEVVELHGAITEQSLTACMPACCEKLLIRGDIHITTEAAQYLAESRVHLLGVESGTVGDERNGVDVHRAVLGAGMVILEHLNLTDVKPGTYLLSAMPLHIKGLDGSPCRPILIEE